MCRAVTCKSCGKKTWAGCGMHVDQVMRGIPAAARCQGHERSAAGSTSFFGRLFSRGQ